MPDSGGDSGSATIEPDARGEEALGRLELRRESGPGRPEGTASDTGVACVEGEAGWTGVDGTGAVTAGVRPSKLIPENPEKLGNWIMVDSSSSIGGRSSSRAEYLPLLGLTAREPAADTCVLLVISDFARRLDFSRGPESSRI